MKVMKRFIPAELLEILEKWLSNCFACVKWKDSPVYFKYARVRQSSVLSVVTVFVRDIGKLCNPIRPTGMVVTCMGIIIFF